MLVKLYNSLKHRLWLPAVQRAFLRSVAEHGTDISLGEGVTACGYERIHFGSHIYIGDGTRFLCAKADVYIGDGVMFGPEVLVVTGDHRIDCVGRPMYTVTEKLPENDRPVHIDEDVWIGARAILLKGTHIGAGSVIAAGAVVRGEVPPCSIYYSRDKICPRFTEEQYREHQEKIQYVSLAR